MQTGASELGAGHMGAGLAALLRSRGDRMMRAGTLAGLGALLYGAAVNQAAPAHGRTAAVTILMVLAGAGWIGWLLARRLELGRRPLLAALALLAAAGGALAPLAPVGLGFPAVAALGAGIAFEGVTALSIAVVGAVALLVSIAVVGAPASFVASGILSVVAGAAAGGSRRAYTERASQAERLLAERARGDAERDRAAALAERNRVGREIHDVLAHSLGALSVQLDAVDAVLEDERDPARVRRMVQEARQLAVQGLEETRQAVHALRDEPVALPEQLQALAARDGAELVVSGAPRPLGAQAGLALYRAAQEAVTNARKHAPGSSVTIELSFRPSSTVLTVVNGPADPSATRMAGASLALGDTGGGFGLQGMRERLAQLGGTVRAEPGASGWTVAAEVPIS